MRQEINAWFDGATEPVNPGGHSSYGAIVEVDGDVVFSESVYLGVGRGMSNNVAEYSGCLAVLRYLLAQHIEKALVRGDSRLVVMQLNGLWRAKGGLYLPYYRDALRLRKQLPAVQLQWIPRAENWRADELSKKVLVERGVRFNQWQKSYTKDGEAEKRARILRRDKNRRQWHERHREARNV